MNIFLAILTITIGYYFVIMLIINKESKDKIFNVAFITSVFLLLTVIISFLNLTIINIILFFIYFILVHGFYTDFILFTKISEYFIKRKDLTNHSGESIQYALLEIIKKQLIELNKELYSIVRLKNIGIDIILFTYGFLLYIFYTLYIMGIINIKI